MAARLVLVRFFFCLYDITNVVKNRELVLTDWDRHINKLAHSAPSEVDL